jgi:hypothetical protein
MAIKREPREDLMRDATAYVRRFTIQNPKEEKDIFVGMRQHGGWSVYFGEDPVYQFNAHSKLRRAHFQNQNYAASHGKLLLLHRDCKGAHVEIQRIYSADTERNIISDCHNRLRELAALLETSVDKCVCFPADDHVMVTDLIGLIRESLELPIAETANA